MNSILISGTYSNVDNHVIYNVNVYATNDGILCYVRTIEGTFTGYNALWKMVKEVTVKYFNNSKYEDGAYTGFLSHLFKK